MTTPAGSLSVSDLSMRFGGLTAVNQVSFEVRSGEIFAVIGPNGAGKTTVFNAITGIYPPSSGKIFFDDHDITLRFSGKTALRIALIATAFAVCVVIGINVQSLWEAAISSRYVYQEPFDWIESAQAALSFLFALPPTFGLIPFIVSLAIGTAGAIVSWQRARRAPDVVADQGISRTFQNIRLFQQMTVLENILVGMDRNLSTGFFSAILRLPSFYRELNRASKKALSILEFVGLAHEANKPACALSYGHQRHLEIARALANQPRILLLDEPAAGMNPSESEELMKLVERIRAQGITILLIEHHMKVVMGISEQIVVLDYGNKIAQGTPEQIKIDPAVIAAYLGEESN